jgi:hypothetical protein
MPDLVDVYTTADRAEYVFLKSLLDANGVRCFVKDQFGARLLPFPDPWFVTLQVVAREAERAREILDEYQRQKGQG